MKPPRPLVDLFLEAYEQAPSEIILDLDATDDPVHGNQEGRFYHGYYDCYCYLPLYIFCGRHLLAARLRSASVGWFASMAYVLLCALRRVGLQHTPFANASCGTIRLKLLKIGALVRVSVRRIKVAMASSCPAAQI